MRPRRAQNDHQESVCAGQRVVRGGIEPPTFRFSGLTGSKVAREPRAWRGVGARREVPSFAAVAVTAAVVKAIRCDTMTAWRVRSPLGGLWEPMSPSQVAVIFAGCPTRWWIAGGYAIEFAVGRPVREHADIDVLLLRRDQLAVQRAMPHWQWEAADPPGSLRPWEPAERLPISVHDIWCRPGPGQPWRIQVMLDESSGSDWVSRRDRRIRRPIASLGLVTADGIPYLAPDVQLFYKAKAPRPKDEVDFTAALAVLTGPQRQWLSHALRLVHGQEHPWLARLAGIT
jgi:hypothetical protein